MPSLRGLGLLALSPWLTPQRLLALSKCSAHIPAQGRSIAALPGNHRLCSSVSFTEWPDCLVSTAYPVILHHPFLDFFFGPELRIPLCETRLPTLFKMATEQDISHSPSLWFSLCNPRHHRTHPCAPTYFVCGLRPCVGMPRWIGDCL